MELNERVIGKHQGSIKRSSVVAALPGRQLKCSNFPGRKKGKRKKKQKEGERKQRKLKRKEWREK